MQLISETVIIHSFSIRLIDKATSAIKMSSDSDDDELMLLMMIDYCEANSRSKSRKTARRSRRAVRDLLYGGNDSEIFNRTRTQPETFSRLRDWFDRNQQVQERPRSRVDLDQVLVYFLSVLGHGDKNRPMQFMWKRGGATISKYFHRVLGSMQLLYVDVVKMPMSPYRVQPRIERASRYYWFRDCIGAVDCSHIDLHVPSELHAAYRNRKGNITQNIFASCNFDMTFSFCLAGGEGSASDNRVYDWAMDNGFHIPPGKFMLADQGFEDCPSLMTPYPGQRYHLREWGSDSNRPISKEELFNLRHAKLRNIIERAFGVLKRKFASLVKAMEYDLDTQVKLVYAAIALHNFIIQSAAFDGFDVDRIGEHRENEFRRHATGAQLAAIDVELNQFEEDLRQSRSNRSGRADEMIKLRDFLATGMWIEYQQWIRTQRIANNSMDEESAQSEVD